uniref:Histidine-rich glycoprotein-like n=1 Tax=Sphaeramia orbicularis TaxID=375764 RepID=A0A672YXK3_9TELE
MKHCVLLSLLLALGCVHGAPVDQDGMAAGSCTDEAMVGVAKEALTKINRDRTEGYKFSFHSLANVHTETHGETGIVYYMTLRVVETNCSVLSGKDWKLCQARPIEDTPVYGQCKAVLYINKPHRVVRLYKYNCVVRPAPKTKVYEVCPDCPTFVTNSDEMKQIASQSMEGFNRQSQLANKFALDKVTRSSLMGMATFYNVEFTIQETTCTKDNDTAAENCPVMDCEFAHKGFCKASKSRSPTGDEEISVQCEIYEPEAAEREKRLHNLGAETDHSHNDTDHTHDHTADQTHDHAHDHTKSHAHHDQTHTHAEGSTHRHAHDHSHDHGHGHDHVHAHHAKAHDHSGDSPNHHHDYKHADGTHTHEHDHELALDHDHKHSHLHEHEHHHHHHDHHHETTAHDHPEGEVKVIPAMGEATQDTAVPSAAPEVGVTLPAKPDPQIPGEREPTVLPYPTAVSAECPKALESNFVDNLFTEDTTF